MDDLFKWMTNVSESFNKYLESEEGKKLATFLSYMYPPSQRKRRPRMFWEPPTNIRAIRRQ